MHVSKNWCDVKKVKKLGILMGSKQGLGWVEWKITASFTETWVESKEGQKSETLLVMLDIISN